VPLRQADALRSAAVTLASMLASFGAGWAVETAAHQHTNLVVLAVALSLTIGRRIRAHGTRGAAVLALPLLAAAAAGVGRLMADHAVIGDALFCVVLAGGVWVRRFGPRWSRLGTLAAMPFIAMLVVPVPALPGDSAVATTGWPVVVAATTMVCVAVVHAVAERTGFVTYSRPEPVRRAPTTTPSPSPSATRRRVPASSRMALQLGLSLALAFLVGHQLFPDHWAWPVITAYVVAAGNRGRGDVVHKSGLRLIGAMTGTVAAALSSGLFAPGDRWSVVAIFALLGIGTWLRSFSYAFWAGAVTACMSLLYGYFGQGGLHVLDERVEGIAAGAAIAVVVAWFVLPVRTEDVVRRRTASTLAALSDFLTAARRRQYAELAHLAERFDHTLAELELVAPALRAHRRTLGRFDDAHPAEAVAALSACRAPVHELAGALAAGGGSPALRDSLASLHEDVVTALRSVRARGTPPTAA